MGAFDTLTAYSKTVFTEYYNECINKGLCPKTQQLSVAHTETSKAAVLVLDIVAK